MRRALLRVALLAGLAFAPAAAGGIVPARALAHDAPMPDDARHGRLVDEPWTMRHWSPFDERLAERELGLAPGGLEAFLYDDHHTIAQLARARGIPFESLVDRLAAWADAAPGTDRAEIEARIRLMLVSGHLAQHVLFHVFHGAALTPVVFAASGFSARTATKRRAAGWSFRRLVRDGDGDPGAVERALRRKIARAEVEGTRAHETPASQAATLAARQQGLLRCWLTRPMQRLDAAAPYGRRYLKHAPGHGAADVPTTRSEQDPEEARIERGLRELRPSCWQPPEPCLGDTGAPLTRMELRALAQLPDGFMGPTNDPHGDIHGGHGGHDAHDG